MGYLLSGVAAGWLPSKLLMGDELDSQPGHAVDPSHRLALLYNTSAQAIVEGNGILFDTPSINAWVLASGGVTLNDGQPVFSNNSVILLPPGGPRLPVGVGPNTPIIVPVHEAGLNPIAVVGFGLLALVLLFPKKKKKGEAGAAGGGVKATRWSF